MKAIRLGLLFLTVALFLSAQTVHLGQHVYFNDEGAIDIAADASLAVQRLDQNYVPFVLFMGMALDQNYVAAIPRENVVLIYKDQEYQLPSLSDFRKEYRRDGADARLYEKFFAGAESLVGSKLRHYRFRLQNQFFPSRSSGAIATNEGSVSGTIGFVTFAYFKNPGFQMGDQVTIKVVDKKNPEIWGSVDVEFRGQTDLSH